MSPTPSTARPPTPPPLPVTTTPSPSEARPGARRTAPGQFPGSQDVTLATPSARRSGSHLKGATLDPQGPRLEQGLRDDASPLFQKTAHGLTGNPQALSRLFVTEALQIDQAHGFELVDLQDQMFQVPGRDPDRLEKAGTGKTSDLTKTVRTSQDGGLLSHGEDGLIRRSGGTRVARPDGPSLRPEPIGLDFTTAKGSPPQGDSSSSPAGSGASRAENAPTHLPGRAGPPPPRQEPGPQPWRPPRPTLREGSTSEGPDSSSPDHDQDAGVLFPGNRLHPLQSLQDRDLAGLFHHLLAC